MYQAGLPARWLLRAAREACQHPTPPPHTQHVSSSSRTQQPAAASAQLATSMQDPLVVPGAAVPSSPVNAEQQQQQQQLSPQPRQQQGTATAAKMTAAICTSCSLSWYLGAGAILAVPAATLGAAAVATFLWLRGRDSHPPDYDADNSTWFAYEHGGTKRADLFYAHPTTHAGIGRWNMAWEDMGETCTGPVAGDPDLLVGQAAAWSEEANLYAPK
eukprot:COSAG01_NODE_9708_length_2364_cov_3.562914_1_plen_216_part_00